MAMSQIVAPHAGAWIEMFMNSGGNVDYEVAPHAGAWIEIIQNGLHFIRCQSLPTRERGLKFRRRP